MVWGRAIKKILKTKYPEMGFGGILGSMYERDEFLLLCWFQELHGVQLLEIFKASDPMRNVSNI